MALPKAVQKQAEEAKKIQEKLNGSEQLAPVDPVTSQPAPAPDDWEKRYKGMQRTHDKTVSGLRDENEGLNTKVEELEALLEKANTAPAAQEPVFSEAEIEEYGQDFLDMVSRIAATKNDSPDSNVAKELNELKTKFDGIAEKQFRTVEDKFFDELDTAVPNWEDINEQDDFKNWLAEEMPLTGQERQKFLENAHKRFDSKAVISFFNAWLSVSGKGYMPDSITVPSELGNENPNDIGIITKRDIDIFYEELKLGKWKGREKEARQNELKIFAAQKAGMIR